MRSCFTLAFLLFMSIMDESVMGQFVAKITASDGDVGDLLGGSTEFGGQSEIAIYGDMAVVSAIGHDDDELDTGAVYVFERHAGGPNLWGQTAKIVPENAPEDLLFGWTVTLTKDRLAVGAVGFGDPNPSPGVIWGAPGTVYLMERDAAKNEWAEVGRLDPPPEPVEGLGYLLGATRTIWMGSKAITASITADENRGRIFVYEEIDSTWKLIDEYIPDDAHESQFFGNDFGMSDDTLLVSAAFDNSLGHRAGEVYQFQLTNSGRLKNIDQFAAAETTQGDWFGESVAVDGDTALISASQQGAGAQQGTGPGVAYIFERSSANAEIWQEVATLLASDGELGDSFGDSIGMDGDFVIVGAPKDPNNDGIADQPGAAYLFGRHAGGLNQWGQIYKLTAPDAQDNDHFGKSVDLHGTTAIVSAPGHNDNTGAAYIFELDAPLIIDFDDSGKLDVADIDSLTRATRNGGYDVIFDVNGDGELNNDDRFQWVREIRNTWFGDANLDGEFNSADLVVVFQAGEYEDDIAMNSSWGTGDWNGDDDFTSADIVVAFQDGGFELGPRNAVQYVPESSFGVSLLAVLVCSFFGKPRLRRKRPNDCGPEVFLLPRTRKSKL